LVEGDGDLRWWLPLLAALVVTALLWSFRQRGARPVLFVWGFFVVALVPMPGFTDVYFITYSLLADHYQHLALIGVFVSV
jgi:protein O-mannosyl-transferase